MAFETKTISVGQLLLDVENPRHAQVESQRDAVHALIETERQKLVVLANDIIEWGLSPIDRLLVIKKGRNYIVVEGNRRLSAIRLIDNPGLAEGTVIEAAIKRVARGGTAPEEVECAVAGSRDEASHWMELRHTGEAGGAGVVRWNSFATNRFSHKPNSQAARAISFLEAVASGYPDNEIIQELAVRVAEKRLTTLGRLVQDPNFRSRIGMVDDRSAIRFEFPATARQAFFEHLLGDIAADVGVSQLKSKEQRTAYLKGTPEPEAKQRLPEAKPLSDAPSAAPSPKPKPRPRPSKPAKPFQTLDLSSLGSKTQALLREFRSLDVDKLPNAAAVLTRAILELSVDQFIAEKSLPTDQKLRKRIGTCLNKVDPTKKADEYSYMRTGLADGTSLYSVNTLHAFVHNQHYHADGTTVRSIAANIQPFLQALNDLV
ncbi:MAG TPA: hypothetical protein VHB30_01540 [Solirubrobacteraceae bacterium]|nr:hypothetical protein [Solirubrobacteraceae bacterium]